MIYSLLCSSRLPTTLYSRYIYTYYVSHYRLSDTFENYFLCTQYVYFMERAYQKTPNVVARKLYGTVKHDALLQKPLP